MVLYFIMPSPSPRDVSMPAFMVGAHNCFKGFQWGLCGGVGIGFVMATRAKVLTWPHMRNQITLWMRNTALVSTCAIAPCFTVAQLYSCKNFKEQQQKGFDVQHDKAQNRLHTLTLYGMLAGALCARRFQGVEGLRKGLPPVFGVSGGGLVLGGFGGFCFDFPISVFVPIYVSHVDDVDFNFPGLIGLEEGE